MCRGTKALRHYSVPSTSAHSKPWSTSKEWLLKSSKLTFWSVMKKFWIACSRSASREVGFRFKTEPTFWRIDILLTSEVFILFLFSTPWVYTTECFTTIYFTVDQWLVRELMMTKVSMRPIHLRGDVLERDADDLLDGQDLSSSKISVSYKIILQINFCPTFSKVFSH